MLEVRDLQTAYGQSQVLFGVNLEIQPGQVVSLLGRNGMGKTTTVRSIMGIVRPQQGTISFQNASLVGLPPLVRSEIYRSIERLKAEGLSILLIDKDVRALTRAADVHYVLEKGRVLWTGTSAQLAASQDVQHRYLGV